MPPTYGRAIRGARQRLGLSYKQLADQADIAHQTMANIESSDAPCSPEAGWRIANVLGVDISDVLRPVVDARKKATASPGQGSA